MYHPRSTCLDDGGHSLLVAHFHVGGHHLSPTVVPPRGIPIDLHSISCWWNTNRTYGLPYFSVSVCEKPHPTKSQITLSSSYLCIRQRKPWTPPPQGSTQIRRRDDVESWGVYFQGLVNLDLINFLTMWIFTLCEFRPGESWTNERLYLEWKRVEQKNWLFQKCFVNCSFGRI